MKLRNNLSMNVEVLKQEVQSQYSLVSRLIGGVPRGRIISIQTEVQGKAICMSYIA